MNAHLIEVTRCKWRNFVWNNYAQVKKPQTISCRARQAAKAAGDKHKQFQITVRRPSPDFGWTWLRRSSSADRRANTLSSGSGWRFCRGSKISDPLAISHFPGSGWTNIQRSSSADQPAEWFLPCSGWSRDQRLRFLGVATSHLAVSDWKFGQTPKFEDYLASWCSCRVSNWLQKLLNIQASTNLWQHDLQSTRPSSCHMVKIGQVRYLISHKEIKEHMIFLRWSEQSESKQIKVYHSIDPIWKIVGGIMYIISSWFFAAMPPNCY